MNNQYCAFISYRHNEQDAAVAKLLHRQLETYHIPSHIQKETGRKNMGKLFRDQDELPLMADLGEGIRQALDQSEWLIVVCSPEFTKSRWCMAEVDYFIARGRRDRILTILVSGEPEESFPPQLLFADDGEEREPLAADVRAESLSKTLKKVKTEKLRLLAPMLGVGYDDLRRRERERRARIAAVVGLSATAAMAVAIIYVLTQNALLEEQRNAAQANEAWAMDERNQALVSQSKFLSGLSGNMLAAGDPTTAALLALEALPNNLNEPDRPLVDEAAAALRNAAISRLQADYTLVGGVSDRYLPQWQYLKKDGVLVIPDTGETRFYNMYSGALLYKTARFVSDFCEERSLFLAREGTNTVVFNLENPENALVELTGPDTLYKAQFAAGGDYVLMVVNSVEGGNYCELFETDTGNSVWKRLAEELLPDQTEQNYTTALDRYALSADGKYLLLVGSNLNEATREEPAMLLDLKTGERIRGYSGFYDPAVTERRFLVDNPLLSPDGTLLCVQDSGWGFQVMSVETGELLYRLNPVDYNSNAGYQNRAFFSPGGKYIAVHTYNGQGYVYDATTGELRMDALVELGPVVFMEFAGDDMLVMRRGENSPTLNIVTPIDEQQNGYSITIPNLYGKNLLGSGTSFTQKSIQVSENNLVVFSEEGIYQLWSRDGKSDIKRFAFSKNSTDYTKAWRADGSGFAVSIGGVVSIHEADGSEVFALPGSGVRHTQLRFSNDGGRLLAVDTQGTVTLYDTNTGKRIHEWKTEYTASLYETVAVISPDWSLFALNNPGHIGGMYDLNTFERLYDFKAYKGGMLLVSEAAFSNNGAVFIIHEGESLVAIDPRTGKELQTISLSEEYETTVTGEEITFTLQNGSTFTMDRKLWWNGLFAPSLTWSKNGRYVAVKETYKETLTVWNSESGEKVLEIAASLPSFCACSRYLCVRRQQVETLNNPLVTDYVGVIYDLETGLVFATPPKAGMFSPTSNTLLMQDCLFTPQALEDNMAQMREKLAGRTLTAAQRKQFFLE
ncbi:TIR domain-containing protein [Christensenellaceae bacterium OttesenSCG-928-L17]|nr:TIR domain-containing protein [Christensenellaceae bacterium OttesenSCG-928-L17]